MCSFEVSFHKNLSSHAWCCSKTYSYQITSLHGPFVCRKHPEMPNFFWEMQVACCLIGFELACAWYLFVTCMNRPLYWNQTPSVYMLTSKNVMFLTGQVCLIPCIWPKGLWWVVAINANSIIEVLGKESNLWLEDPFLMVESCTNVHCFRREDSPIERGLCQPARTNGSICESISDLFWNKGSRNSERAYYFKVTRQGTSNCWNFTSRFQYLKNPVAH